MQDSLRKELLLSSQPGSEGFVRLEGSSQPVPPGSDWLIRERPGTFHADGETSAWHSLMGYDFMSKRVPWKEFFTYAPVISALIIM